MFNSIPLFLLYPEIHYHIGFLYPLYYRRVPEVIADLPTRIEAHKNPSIPILIIVKDAHRFPVILNKISVTVLSKQLHMQKTLDLYHNIETRYFSQIITLTFPQIDFSQPADITVTFHLTRKQDGKNFIFQNDNLPGIHTRLRTFLSVEPIPNEAHWYAGEPHYHSFFTEDQVEFGADIDSAVQLAKRMGLHWLFITDHSYDLDDDEGNSLLYDSSIPKWQKLKQHVKTIQKMEKFPVFWGEEVSCGNKKNKNIHLLVINNEQFIEGKGDSAEHWFHNAPTLSLPEVIARIEQDALAIGAHTSDNFQDPISTILLKRGIWTEEDIAGANIIYLQILNEDAPRKIEYAKKEWISLLLKGYKVTILAGNDAHGYFNCTRKVGIPFLNLIKSKKQIFGNLKTYIKADCPMAPESFIDSFKNNRIIVSNGPFARLTVNGHEIGSTITVKENDELKVEIYACSSEEFGLLKSITLLSGVKEDHNEKVEKKWQLTHYKFSDTITLQWENQNYFRLEAITDDKKFCLTNPVWFCKFNY
jgi:hypothetical protein